MNSSRGEARRFDAVPERKYAPTMPRATPRLPSEIRHLSGDRGKTNGGLRLGEVQLSNSKSGEHFAGVHPALCSTRGKWRWISRKCMLLYTEKKWRRPFYSRRRELTTMTPSTQLRGKWIEAKRSQERLEEDDPDPFSSSRCNVRPI